MVNRQLPEAEQFSYIGWHLFKYLRLSTQYHRLYPNGSLLKQYRDLTISFFILMLLAGIATVALLKSK